MIKGTHNLRYYQKKLSNGHWVLDFNKLYESPFTFIVILSERGSLGKTLGVKELMRERFNLTGNSSIYMMNSNPLLESVKEDWFKDLNKKFVKNEIGETASKFWDDSIIKGESEKNNIQVKHDGKQFVKILNIRSAEKEKGARPEREIIAYDEINVGMQSMKLQTMLWDSLMHSNEDVVNFDGKPPKYFLFGNNKSLSIPLIYNMGITSLKNEISELYAENGIPLTLVIAPQYDIKQREQIEKENENNPIYWMSKQLGTHKHSYFNDSLFDDMNSIRRYTDSKENAEFLLPQFSVHHKEQYYNAYRVRFGSEKGKYHIVMIDKKDRFSTLFAFQRYDVIEKCSYTRKHIKGLHKFIEQDYITFENTMSRDLFISSIK